jgi:hypothetical protein
MNSDLLQPRDNLIGQFHSLALPDKVIHIFTYYSPAQSISGKCIVTEFYSCLQKCNALIYLVMYEDTTHKPMSFKATHVLSPYIFVNSMTKEGSIFHTTLCSNNLFSLS